MGKKRPSRGSSLTETGMKLVLNALPTYWTNSSYNLYSRIYEGQLRLGLPVSKKLLQTQEEIRSRAAGKLALTLYHIFFHVTGTRIPRNEIKLILQDELNKERLRLTEDVIILTETQLTVLARDRFHIGEHFLPDILASARRRRIMKETLRQHRAPAYFEMDIDEKEVNGRGDYEVVYYNDFTEEGKSIGFRRLASMEEVTAGDNRPSLVMVPGIGCNSNCFNLNNRYSMAKDMADMGFWVYLFDPRGMGVNEGKFDPMCTVDTLIDYDLSTVVRFIGKRSHEKPVILLGHSMGGIISECMILNWSLRKNFHRLDMLTDRQLEVLDKVLPPLEEAKHYLSMIRGVICLGSPKFFQRTSHLLFPASLWLNHISRVFRLRYVPFRESIWFLTRLPGVRAGAQAILNMNTGGLNPLISPENHKKDKRFIMRYLQEAGESFPLGVGFQFLKGIYNGEGFKRMDETRLNYSSMLPFFPEDIPVFHFWGTDDPLGPPANMRYSRSYPHRYKKVYRISSLKDVSKVEISQERSQLIDFVIEGVNHLDLLYGQTAEKMIQPLIIRCIRQAWSDWKYERRAEIKGKDDQEAA